MIDIYNFKSSKPKTIFAPEWDYFIFVKDASEEIDIEYTKKFLLSKEKEIVSRYDYEYDWNTGLGENSVTARSNSYNLLDFIEMGFLNYSIRKAHDEFVSAIGKENKEKLYIQCWYNVMRKGDKIQSHQHWNSPYTYLGGHICIQQENTSTWYTNPITRESYEIKNVPGTMTLFPNWVFHHTDIHQGESERITIAFDIITETVFNEDIFDNKKHHWVEIKNDNELEKIEYPEKQKWISL
jgi:hypothetical protein